jgi:glutamate racemase
MEENRIDKLVGIFDSGIGGLSVVREIQTMIPFQPLYYIADQAHVPYGKRDLTEIRDFSFAITDFLIEKGAELIVVACNTASAAALKELREAYPSLTFVGMEPAVKPATEKTHNGVVGVLATPATFQGKLYHTLVERFAQDVKILTHTCPGLVEAIELGDIHSSNTRLILKQALLPMLEKGADTIVLGCTHFPFIIPIIRDIVGPNISVIDPAPAIAKRVGYLLNKKELINGYVQTMQNTFSTTGNHNRFKQALHTLLGIEVVPVSLKWDHLKLIPA